MKSFDQWFEEQGRLEQQEANEAANPGLQWREYDKADKPDPDDPYPQAGECCRCGATTEFHDGNFFYCGGSPRCCP